MPSAFSLDCHLQAQATNNTMGNKHSGSDNTSFSSDPSQEKYPGTGKRGSKAKKSNGSPGLDAGTTVATAAKGKKTAKAILKSWAPPVGDGVPGEATRLAKAWVQAKNERNMMKLISLAHPEACYRLPAENICIPMRDFIDTIFALADSFPDLTYKFADAGEPRLGSAVLYEYYATGTHTGAGYSFQGRTMIPPTNVQVLDGPVVKTITVQNGKIIDFLVYAPLGNRVGPLAFYEAAKNKVCEKKALSPHNFN